MNACRLFHNLALGFALLPFATNGQQVIAGGQQGWISVSNQQGWISGRQEWVHPASYSTSDPGDAVTSNVPLNEINTHAFRHFHRLFPAGTSGESWFKSAEGYQVSFVLEARHHQAYFDRRGAFLYSLEYYDGKEIPRGAGESIVKKYPDYRIDVVTEITDGEKTFYLVKIVNSSFVRTLSICDGRIEVIDEMINGGA